MVLDLWNGKELLTKSGESVPASSVFNGDKRIILYFSAHWCLPCRRFTPKLKEFYEEAKELGHDIEVIFVSADKSEEEQVLYHQNEHGDWLRVKFEDEELREKLRDVFGKKLDSKTSALVRSGIPCLVVLDKDFEAVKSYDGVSDVEVLGAVVLDMKW